MDRGKEEKKLIYISKNLIDRLNQLALSQGTTIRKLIDDAIIHYLKIAELGYEPGETIEILKALRTVKTLGGVYIPKLVLEHMENSSHSSREEVARKWYEAGKIYGIYIREKEVDPIKTLNIFLKLLRWDLDDVAIDYAENLYRVRCASPSLTEEDTYYLAEFIKGVLEGLNMNILKIEFVRGLIIAKFTLSPNESPSP